MNHEEIRANDRHICERARGYCLSTSCLLLSSGFEETETFRDSRSPLYVENPPLCQQPSLSRYTMIPYISAHDRAKCTYLPNYYQDIARAMSLPRRKIFTTACIVDDYLTVSYVQNLLFAHRPRFNTLSLSFSASLC